MARQTHYSKGYLSKIETGAKRATVDVARRCDQILEAEGGLLRLLTRPPEHAEEADSVETTGETAKAETTDGARAEGDGAAVTGRVEFDAVCPYRGLSAFTAQDAQWFFGRERATAALVERVFERVGSGPLMVVAPSGAGKSSLFNAGLVPAFRNPGGFPMPGVERWPVVVFTPTAHPLEELLTGVAKAFDGGLGVSVRQLRDRPEALLEAVRRRADDDARADGDRRPPPVRPVLLVDQFEELFTLCSDEDERRAFVRVLCALSTARRPSDPADGHGGDPAVVVLGLRADLSGRCIELPELAPVFSDGLFVLPPMSVAGLREAITRPAELAGLTLESGLVPLLLRDAGLRDEPAGLPGDGSDPGRALPDVTPSGALPLISHALLTTWQRREGATLTVAGYERTGGIRGAVARTAEDVFAGLYPSEQQTIRRILVRLVHVADGTGPARCRTSRAALMERSADTDGATAALDAFVRARLITADRDTVEIAHEALLHAWPRLRGWIDADRHGLLIHQQLAHAADEWEREDGDPSALYRGTRLDTVRMWAGELDGRSRLSAQEEAFLSASLAEEADRQRQARRQIRRRQGTLATLVVLLTLAVVAGALAYRQRSDAASGAGRPLPGTRRAVRLPGRRPARGFDAARRGRLPVPGDARGARRPAEHPDTALLGPARRVPGAGQLGGFRA
ncbi:hypothetical protein ACIBAH_21880 [Streptomyces sp. NPDC051445]|uniref:nSTAND1 domain-containing NTPase n=1 Tax=Streptomyces sp. NPDC051445 TaxID=3365653 RepID=UPI0037ABD0AC